MRVEIRQGRKGRWRWMLYDDAGKFVAICGVRGFLTHIGAIDAAKTALGSAAEIAVDGYEQFAGLRDWAD